MQASSQCQVSVLALAPGAAISTNAEEQALAVFHSVAWVGKFFVAPAIKMTRICLTTVTLPAQTSHIAS